MAAAGLSWIKLNDWIEFQSIHLMKLKQPASRDWTNSRNWTNFIHESANLNSWNEVLFNAVWLAADGWLVQFEFIAARAKTAANESNEANQPLKVQKPDMKKVDWISET